VNNKIAIFINSLGQGGAERIASILLKYLQEEKEVHLILLKNEINYTIPKNQIIHVLKGESSSIVNFIKIPLLAYELMSYLKKNDIPIVFSLLTLPNIIASFMKKIGWEGKVIISERTMTPVRYSSLTIKGFLISKLIKQLYPFANIIIPNSKGVQYGLEKDMKIKNNYQVIYNPIDIEQVNVLGQVSIPNFEHSKNFTFICVGNFFDYKNKTLLINAFAKLNKLNCRLILIGGGVEVEYIKRKIQDLGLSESVYLTGYHPNPYQYLAISDCFISPSNIEGFPNVILEALAMGLPVISTDCQSGPREMLAPRTNINCQVKNNLEIGEYGILVPVNNDIILAEAMFIMYNNFQLREEYKSKSLKRASDFNIDNIIDEFKKIFSTNISS
jgi:N-acetylgalactosamine-N,N'-diacetylbacillosaminyl-diphospho-undecaprenol 4-alpha-N-acetylgalactosaminyltransferase